jgi:hypothetical protein
MGEPTPPRARFNPKTLTRIVGLARAFVTSSGRVVQPSGFGMATLRDMNGAGRFTQTLALA